MDSTGPAGLEPHAGAGNRKNKRLNIRGVRGDMIKTNFLYNQICMIFRIQLRVWHDVQYQDEEYNYSIKNGMYDS